MQQSNGKGSACGTASQHGNMHEDRVLRDCKAWQLASKSSTTMSSDVLAGMKRLHSPTASVARLRGGSKLVLGMSFVVSKLVAAFGPVLAILSFAAAGHSHGHSHSHEAHSNEHPHGHFHSHAPVSDLTEGSALWNFLSAATLKHPATSAIVACGIVSCSALFVMPFLPFLKDGGDTVSVHNSVLLKMLISFAVGGLLGDVFLHMLPHMISKTFASSRHEDEVMQALRFGCPILGGMLIFYLAEKIMAAVVKDSSVQSSEHGHSHFGHSHGSPPHRHDSSSTPKRYSKDKGNNKESKPAKCGMPLEAQGSESAHNHRSFGRIGSCFARASAQGRTLSCDRCWHAGANEWQRT
jgi:hypothetical protein